LTVIIHKKNALYKRRNDSPLLFDTYRTLKKQTAQLIINARQHFIDKILTNNTNKNIWKVINKFLRPQSYKIHHNLSDLNKHFANTAKRVLGHNPTHHPRQPSTGSFKFSPTNTTETSSIILSLHLNAATGHDNIPISFIKPAHNILAPHISNIINTCIQNSYFPNSFKIGRVVPVPKKNTPNSLDDYRPITVLSCMSKIFEKVLANQIHTHINTQSIFPSSLMGGRSGHSTTSALLLIKDACLKSIKSS